ncbi:MAG: hypothetical protein WCY89_06200 [Flavobacteriaceae bacterium]
MKKLVVIAGLFFACLTFGQHPSGYDFVLVPDKFDFLDEKDEYRINSLAKYLLEKRDFKAFLASDDKPIEYSMDECGVLQFDLTKEKTFLNTKLKITVRDCTGKVIAESFGTSKEKKYERAYNMALREALDVLYIPQRENIAKKHLNTEVAATQIEKTPEFLYATPTSQGYKLLDYQDNEVYTLFKTSKPDQFIVSNKDINGALYRNGEIWVLEYLNKDNQIVKESLKIKF